MEVRIDLHVHSKLSNDGRSSIDMLAQSAAMRGLDAIVLTDHDACALDKPEQRRGIWLLPGCECSTDAGHILGLFFDTPPDLDALRTKSPPPSLPSAADTVAVFRECGAMTVLAHPYTKKDAIPYAPVDCIETANARVYFKNPNANVQAENLARLLQLPGTGGSDAHAAREVGNAYTVINASDCSLPSLRHALKSGCCRPVLVKNTSRRFKGYSQLNKALRSRNPGKIVKGLAYLGYCVMLDFFQNKSEANKHK